MLKFDEWIRIVTTDEQAKITSVLSEINQIEEFDLDGSKFRYPNTPIGELFPTFYSYIGKRLISFKELVRRDYNELSV